MARVQIRRTREELQLLNEMVDALMHTVGQITVHVSALDRVAMAAEGPLDERRPLDELPLVERHGGQACSPRS